MNALAKRITESYHTQNERVKKEILPPAAAAIKSENKRGGGLQ